MIETTKKLRGFSDDEARWAYEGWRTAHPDEWTHFLEAWVEVYRLAVQDVQVTIESAVSADEARARLQAMRRE